MFLRSEAVMPIVAMAEGDLRSFFNSNFSICVDERLSLISHLRSLDAMYFDHEYEDRSSAEFVEGTLSWLEMRQKKGEEPWFREDADNLVLRDDGIRAVLTHLETWLSRLVLAGNKGVPLEGVPFHLRGKWKLFNEFLSQEKLPASPWRIVVHTANENDKRILGSFVSWLGTTKKEKTLHILINQEAIQDSTSEEGLQHTRLERVCLHEVGHARNQLMWYLEQRNAITQTTWAKSEPWHECEAWAYALILRSLVVAERSRVTRIMAGGDYEWRGY